MAEKQDKDGFTQREREFCLHYIGAAQFNATEAAILAGYGKGNRELAKRRAWELKQKPHVRDRIEALCEARNEKLAVTAEDILRELVTLSAEAKALPKTIQSMKVRREVLKDMGEHIQVNAFRRQVGLSNPNGGPIETADAAALASLSDEELTHLERAREILDRTGNSHPVDDSDSSGEGAPPEAL